jgi:hypothetical protein
MTHHPVYADQLAQHIVQTQLAPLLPPAIIAAIYELITRDERQRIDAHNRVSAFQPGWPMPLESAAQEAAQ